MLEQLARALEAAGAEAVAQAMAGAATLHIGVHDQPFEGRPAAAQIPGAVLDG
jgi:hypothetical protein